MLRNNLRGIIVCGIIYGSEVFVNGLKKYYSHARFGIFRGGLKINIDDDVFKVFIFLGGR